MEAGGGKGVGVGILFECVCEAVKLVSADSERKASTMGKIQRRHRIHLFASASRLRMP